MEEPDVETLIWRMFMIVTQRSAVHLANEYLDNLHSTENHPQRTVNQLFDVTSKLFSEQTTSRDIQDRLARSDCVD